MTRRLADVAAYAKVSEATVSRVLNGKAGVSKATQQAVLTALDVLGYERPTQLRGQRARLVGLVLPELQNPIFPAFAEVMGVALAQRGFTPVLCTQTAGGVSEAEYVDLLLQQQVSGVVFAGGLYALYAPTKDVPKPVGQFNQARIVVDHGKVQHWLNGEKVCEYDINSADFKARVAASKFKQWPQFATGKTGAIALQNHGNAVWFRNLKIRILK